VLEALEIELARLDPEEISRWTREQALVPGELPEGDDTHLQGLPRRGRGLLAPQVVDEAIGGHDLTGMQEQKGEDCALFRTLHSKRGVAV
jgi:hypothetical protein